MKALKLGIGLVIVVFGALVFVQSFSFHYYTKYGPGSGFFPIWMSGALLVLSLVFIVESILGKEAKGEEILPRGKSLIYILASVGGVALFIILVPPLGFTIPCAIMLFLMMVGFYRWYVSIPLALVSSFVLLVAFQSLLGLSLPVNALGF
ncbi:MAG: tripartite tricarboxylate transporter TctB family protein [Rectinemataceae bacterium]